MGRSNLSDPNRVDQRRVPVAEKKSFVVAKMWDKHHEIARLLVLGLKGRDVAKQVGTTEEVVSQVRNSPVVQDKLAILHAARDANTMEISKEILKLAPIAIKRVTEALNDGMILGKEVSASNMLKEANSVLDRAAGKAIQRVDARHLNATFTLSDIERIKEKAKSLAAESGILDTQGTTI